MKIYPVILVIALTSCSNSFHDTIEPSFVRDWEDRESKLISSLSFDTDEDGIIDYWDQCMSTPLLVKVSAQGCPLDTNGNGLPDYQETAAKDAIHTFPARELEPAAAIQVSDVIAVDDSATQSSFTSVARLYGFEFESEQINDAINKELNVLVEQFNADDSLRAIELTGHTDQLGSASYNQELSLFRAETVATFFRERIRSDIQVMVRGMGELLPIADNTTAEGRALNRRVEVQTLNKK